jgi:hypothetical protein
MPRLRVVVTHRQQGAGVRDDPTSCLSTARPESSSRSRLPIARSEIKEAWLIRPGATPVQSQYELEPTASKPWGVAMAYHVG